MIRSIITLTLLALGSGSSLAKGREHALVREGADFCFRRSYGRVHLAAHPGQLISSIAIMGRNACAVNGALYASARVTFRDRRRALDLYGRCFERDEKPGLLRCSFVPDAFQDVLGQTIELEGAGDRVKATASADWLVVRAGKAPDGPYGGPATDDAVFLLAKEPIAACKPPTSLWGPKGATPKLIGNVP